MPEHTCSLVQSPSLYIVHWKRVQLYVAFLYKIVSNLDFSAKIHHLPVFPDLTKDILQQLILNDYLRFLMALYCGSAGKEFACNTGDLGLTPGLGRSPEEWKGFKKKKKKKRKGKATLSNILAWRFHGLSMGWQRVGHNWVTFTFISFRINFMYFLCWIPKLATMPGKY